MPITSHDLGDPLILSDNFSKLNIPSYNGDRGNRPWGRSFSYLRDYTKWDSKVPGIQIIMDEHGADTVNSADVKTRLSLNVTVNNFGSTNVTSALLEGFVYGALPQITHGPPPPIDFMVQDKRNHLGKVYPITVTNIPEGETKSYTLPWSVFRYDRAGSINTFFVFVRLIDTYSLINHPNITQSWNPGVNPQVAVKKQPRRPYLLNYEGPWNIPGRPGPIVIGGPL